MYHIEFHILKIIHLFERVVERERMRDEKQRKRERKNV